MGDNGTEQHIGGIHREEAAKTSSKGPGLNVLQQIECRRNPANDEGQAALPRYAVAQSHQTGALNHHAARHHERHRLGWRPDVEKDCPGHGRECKAGQAGDERAGKDTDAEKTIRNQVGHGLKLRARVTFYAPGRRDLTY
jgi:hypothetical protein